MTDTAENAPAPAQAGATPSDHVPLRTWIAFIVMAFGMFMAILDIQIVASALSDIQAGISASADEIAWVQTSYRIAEVIMIPLSGILARIFSTRVVFSVSAAAFTACSALCATATSIDQMIVYRALQGFMSGGMVPSGSSIPAIQTSGRIQTGSLAVSKASIRSVKMRVWLAW